MSDIYLDSVYLHINSKNDSAALKWMDDAPLERNSGNRSKNTDFVQCYI